MKVTKFIHSCLLVEEKNKKILIDPGNYTADSKTLNLESIGNLDYLLITHEHQDHIYLPLVKDIISKSPNIKVITNKSVKNLLGKEDINSSVESDEFIKIEAANHEKIFMGEAPMNVMFRINNLFTHPGDSFSFNSTTKILALPVQAPWGSLTQAVELAEKLKPEIVIPIHDWHWNEAARKIFYSWLEAYFKKKGIKFVGLQTGVEVEI